MQHPATTSSKNAPQHHLQRQGSTSVVSRSAKPTTTKRCETLRSPGPRLRAPSHAPAIVLPMGRLAASHCVHNESDAPSPSLTLPSLAAAASPVTDSRRTLSRSSSLDSLFGDDEPASPTTQVSLLAPARPERAPTPPVTKPASTTAPVLTLPQEPKAKNAAPSRVEAIALKAHGSIKAPDSVPSVALRSTIRAAGPPPQPRHQITFAPRGFDALGYPIPAPPEELAAALAYQDLSSYLRRPEVGPLPQLSLPAPPHRFFTGPRSHAGALRAVQSHCIASPRLREAAVSTRAVKACGAASESVGRSNASGTKLAPPKTSGPSQKPPISEVPAKTKPVTVRSGAKSEAKKVTQTASGTAVESTSAKAPAPVRRTAGNVRAQNEYTRNLLPAQLKKYSWMHDTFSVKPRSVWAAKKAATANKGPKGDKLGSAQQVEEVQPSTSVASSSQTTAPAKRRAEKQKNKHDAESGEPGSSKRARRDD